MPVQFRHRRPLVALAIFLSLIFAASLGVYYWLLADLPSLDGPAGTDSSGGSLYDYAAAPSSKIYDRQGRLLFEMPPPHTGRHSPVPLGQMPQALLQAIVATEDGTYYQNPGVDAWAIVRAVWINLQGGEILSGGSTITQQLARTLLLSPEERYERTLTRKLREAVLAWRLARTYSKDEILELYLNEIYFGNLAYGVEAAAQAYFGKHVRDLDLAECAMLAGLAQAPAYYNPLEHLDRATVRQAIVLDLMVKRKYLTGEEARRARQEKLYFASTAFEIRAPHFVMYVRGLLEESLGLERLERGGLQIHTTLDLDLNETARDLVRYRLSRLAECDGQLTDCPPGGHNVRNAALVALDPQTGEILAMLGSPDYFSARIDGAVNGTTALRQPGSSIKPITYAAAFEQGTAEGGALTPATMMLDVRTSFVTKEAVSYVPLNYDLQFRGPVRLREALASSYNLIAVKVLDTIGVEAMTNLARRLGITTFDDPDRLGLAVTLGGGEVRLLELATAYAVFANGGHAVQPVAIRHVEDADGNILLTSGSSAGGRILDERIAYLISDILSDDLARAPSFGEGSVLKLTRPAAVKTGTTTDFRDNWTVGYTPTDPEGDSADSHRGVSRGLVDRPGLVVGVWTGNADSEPMRDVSGIDGAAPIWHDFVEAALKGQPAGQFFEPAGLVRVEVCAQSGLLPERDCPHLVTEVFIEGTEPAEHCTMHQRFALDRATGLRATADTPADRITERVYTTLPPQAQEWARRQGIPEPPPGRDPGLQLAKLEPPLRNAESRIEERLVMSSPDPGAIFRLDLTLPREAQQIEVAARPAVSLAEVTLLVDGLPLARLGVPPYTALWQLEPGMHLFSAEGETANGEWIRSNEVWVEVR